MTGERLGRNPAFKSERFPTMLEYLNDAGWRSEVSVDTTSKLTVTDGQLHSHKSYLCAPKNDPGYRTVVGMAVALRKEGDAVYFLTRKGVEHIVTEQRTALLLSRVQTTPPDWRLFRTN
jgi:hypothetical protein